jgi:serine/threonine protein kinase
VRQFEAGEIIAGKYQLQRPLAKGGMGSVWTAWNQQLEVPVAIKFMAPDALGSAELVARFEREAKAAAQMRVPQVVQIFEHGVFQGLPYMVMELMEGEDLGKRLRSRVRLSLQETARIATEVCKALRRAHELGIVHRDLKPANVFIVQNGDEEVIKVLDFGIAKMLGVSAIEATKTGALIGTPNYMSPEQANRKNRQVDHRSDLWSLGVIAFRCVTGKLPFAGGEPINVLMRIITQPAPAASSMAPDIGPDVDRFFARALATEPEDRFQNAREFTDALNALAASPVPQPYSGGPRTADPPAQPYPNRPRTADPPVQSYPNRPPTADPPAQPYSGGPRTADPLAQSGNAWRPPPPRASQPGDAPRPAAGSTLPIHTPAVPAVDLADGATTVPIQRSPVGQAYLNAATSASPSPAPAQGAAAPGLTRQPSSPYGFGGAPQSPPAHSAAAPPSPQASPAPQGSSQAWQGSSGGKVFKSTLPLGVNVAAAAAAHARGRLDSIPEGQASSVAAAASAAMTSAGETAGTITSATGEMPAQRTRRTSYVVWAAAAAAVLVVIVVFSVVATSTLATHDEPPIIPIPTATAPILTSDPPAPTVTPGPSAMPGMTASASATSSASVAPSTVPSAKPSTAPTTGSAKPTGTGKPNSTSAIFGTPVF